MSRWRLVLILLLCVLAPVASWAAVLDASPAVQSATTERSAANAPHYGARHAVMVAAADQADADGDDAACNDGHCKHCGSGCDMGVCASPCLALPGQPLTILWTGPAEAIASALQQTPADMRRTAPLRPPIV